MTSFSKALSNAIVCCCVGACATSGVGRSNRTDVADGETPGASGQAKIILLGTLHGMHQTNLNYSQAVLTDIIVKLNPHVLLVELPPEIDGHTTVENGRVVESLGSANENAAANKAAECVGIPIIPYDRDRRNEIYKETKYFERQEQAERQFMDWLKALQGADPESLDCLTMGVLLPATVRSQDSLIRIAGPKVINSEAHDMIIRNKMCLVHEIRPKVLSGYPEQAHLAEEYLFFKKEWEERNRIMADNIVATARRHPGQRLVVLCGAEHRYILRDLLSDNNSVKLSEYYETSQGK